MRPVRFPCHTYLHPKHTSALVSLQLRPVIKPHGPERTNVCFPSVELMKASVPATSALQRGLSSCSAWAWKQKVNIRS